MPHLSVPGAELYYETDGPASAPALLLFHAGLASLRMWDDQVDALARDHYVVRYDARGFGQTRAEDAPFSDRSDALDLLDHLGIARATLVGCSRGGGIAIDFALEHPDRVTGLFTVGSGPSGFPHEQTELEGALFDGIRAAYAAGEWQAAVRLETDLWAIGPLRAAGDLDPEFVESAYALNRVNAQHRSRQLASRPLDPPAYDRVGDIAVPTLAAVGEFDITVALAEQAYLVESVRGADGHVFRGAAHIPSVEQPEQFTRVLVDWLGRREL